MMEYIKVGKYVIGYTPFKIDSEYINFPWKLDAFACKVDCDVDFYYKMDQILSVEEIENMLGEVICKEYSGFFYYKIYKCSSGFVYTLRRIQGDKIVLAYEISSDWKLWRLIYDQTATNGRYAFEHFMMLFSYAVLNYGGIVFHSSLIEYNNKGILICAPSGTGKTTHARLWRDYENALIINGDRPLCIKESDVWYAYGTPWCGTSGEYINRRVQVKAIVVLEQDLENIVSKLDVMTALAKILSNVTVPMWDEALMNKAMDYIEDILVNIPVYNLKCRPDRGAVDVLRNEIDSIF